LEQSTAKLSQRKISLNSMRNTQTTDDNSAMRIIKVFDGLNTTSTDLLPSLNSTKIQLLSSHDTINLEDLKDNIKTDTNNNVKFSSQVKFVRKIE